jgi:hypothetical protein
MWTREGEQTIQVRGVHDLAVLELTASSRYAIPEPKTPIIPTQEISIHRLESIIILWHPQNGFINTSSITTSTTRIIQPSSRYSSIVARCGDKNGKRRFPRSASRQTRPLRNSECCFTVERIITKRRPWTIHHEPSAYDIPILYSSPTFQNQHIQQFLVGSYPEYYVSAYESVPFYGVSE